MKGCPGNGVARLPATSERSLLRIPESNQLGRTRRMGLSNAASCASLYCAHFFFRTTIIQRCASCRRTGRLGSHICDARSCVGLSVPRAAARDVRHLALDARTIPKGGARKTERLKPHSTTFGAAQLALVSLILTFCVTYRGPSYPTRRMTSSWNWPWRVGPISRLPSTPEISQAPSASVFE